jgi:hypothetical protein
MSEGHWWNEYWAAVRYGHWAVARRLARIKKTAEALGISLDNAERLLKLTDKLNPQ